MKISTPSSAHRGAGVQTGQSLVDQHEKKQRRLNTNALQQNQYMKKQSLSHMAQRFTRDLSDTKQQINQLGSNRNQLKLGRNDDLYSRNYQQDTSRSAVSAIVSSNIPFKKEGVDTKSISHIPQKDARQITPRTLEHSFLLAKKQQEYEQGKAERSIQKRRYNVPGRDLLDNTNAKALYGNTKINIQSHQPLSDHRGIRSTGNKNNMKQEFDNAISTLLEEEKRYQGMRRDLGQRIPQGYVNRNRDIKPDPDDIDDDVEAPYIDHAITTISPLVSRGIPRPPQKQVLLMNERRAEEYQQKFQQSYQSLDDPKIQELPPKSKQQKIQNPIQIYQLGIGQGLKDVKNFDPLFGRPLSNKGETQSHRSTAEVVQQLYNDLDAFEAANLNLQQPSSSVDISQRDNHSNIVDDDVEDADFQRQE